MLIIWLSGLVRRRGGFVAAAAGGVAIAVALLATLGAFLVTAQASMTARAVRDVAVDWQVQVQPGANPDGVLAVTRAAAGVRAALPVSFGQSTGLSATTPTTAADATTTTTQTTGPGVVLGLPAGYQAAFPGEIRTLTGADHGVLLAQQTAANLHAKPGDVVSIARAGMAAAPVTVDGVVELPQANSLFQTVGAPAGAQPAAPPDNVVLLPQAQWHAVFDPLAATRPDVLATQIHVARTHQLPADPAAAYTDVLGAANNLQAQTTGGGVVGDNLGAALDAARSDAAYARVLFVFLGLPGAVLAGLLTAAVSAAGATRRRGEQALLRTRGATAGQLLGLAAAEAAAIGVAGSVLGLGVAALIGRFVFGTASMGATPSAAAGWIATAAVMGLVIAAASVLIPAYRDRRGSSVAAGRAAVGRAGTPWWARYGLDVVLLAAGAVVVAVTSGAGYQLVLAPEGVRTISVSYWAFAGPALVWAGGGLGAWHLADLMLGRGRGLVGRGVRPIAGGLAPIAAATMARTRRPLARSIALLGVALAFAASTAIFNATYQAQAEADAQLSNGADVTVSESPGASVGPDAGAALGRVAGVRAMTALQHRFAYIGADLQDLYGVNPATITTATAVQDTYFQGGSAAELINRLATAPDSILVSAETVKDYQLHPGDPLTLRLQDARTHQLRPVLFHYAGVVNEFPTAPKDSFFVADAGYITQQTGSDAVGSFLLDTGGHNTTAVADRVRAVVGTTAAVTDIGHTRSTIGSSLTSVDLAGLTRVELGFALALAAAAGGLVLALGLRERRRTFAIATALGANRRQLRGLILSEVIVLAVGGIVAGAALGWALSRILVAVLTGVFDPPPTALSIPGPYLVTVVAITVLALGGAAALTLRSTRRPAIATLREL